MKRTKEIYEQRIEKLNKLNQSVILTEEDWKDFTVLFGQVYKGFLIRLKEKHPRLTQAEIRLICLTKLKMDDKQMAKVLGLGYGTIRHYRYLLRKKLGTSGNDSLSALAESI